MTMFKNVQRKMLKHISEMFKNLPQSVTMRTVTMFKEIRSSKSLKISQCSAMGRGVWHDMCHQSFFINLICFSELTMFNNAQDFLKY